MISPVVQPEVAREQIRLLLDRINDAWLKLAPEDIPAALDDCFDDQAVIKGPDLTVLANGKQACIRSYTDFLQQASVRNCTLSLPDIQLFDNTAIATYRWTILYQMSGQEYRDSGFDVFVLSQRDPGQKWFTVWRAMFPEAHA